MKKESEFPVKTIQDFQTLGPRMKWQFFERLVAFVFKQNDYEVAVSVVKRLGKKRSAGNTKRQYDVIAESPRHVFAADCKRWTGRRYKSSMLKSAAEKQIERCMFLKAETKKPILPLIVTLMREDVVIHDGVPVVPIEMLNSFIHSWEMDDDQIRQI
jgi:hypothetical protein